MKKLFTLIALACLTLTAAAEDIYRCGLAVIANGNPSDYQQIDLSCTPNDKGKYDILLPDFTFEGLNIGDIVINDIDTVEDEGTIQLTTEQDIEVAVFPGVKIPISFEGYIVDGELTAQLKINAEGMNVNVVISSRSTQIYGSDFENWHKANNADEPNGWHAIKSGTGLASLATNGVSISDDVPEGSKGTKSVRIQSTVTMGISANGTITTGRMAVGAMEANSSKNCTFIDPTSTDVDGNGDPFFNSMVGRPSAIGFWYKFKNGEGNTKPAMVRASIVDDGYYQDPIPEGTTYDNLVAVAEQTLDATESWTYVTVPFDYANYADYGADSKSILVTINTCCEPGGGSKSSDNPDVLYVDDVNLIYDPDILDILIFDEPIEDFEYDKYEGYKITVPSVPTDDDIEVVCSNEQIAGPLTYYENGILNIFVYNEELQNPVKYSVKLNIDPTGINAVEGTGNNTVVGRYNINGQRVGKTAKGMVITKYADGTAKKTLR